MSRTLLALALLSLVGCPGKAADEGPHCEDTPTDIAVDESTALGFTAAEVLAVLPPYETTELQYVDASTTALDIAFTPGSTYRFVDSEAVYPEGETTDIGVICDDRVEIDGTLHFFTGDGAFQEDLATTVDALSLGDVGAWEELDLAAMTGSLDFESFVQSPDWDELSAWISIRFSGGVSSGEVSGQASGEDDCVEGETCSAWAEEVPVGFWPSAE